MNNKISEILFKIAARKRNPSLFSKYEELKAQEKLSREELLKYQEEQLKLFLQFCYEKSDFYKNYFDKHDFSPYDSNFIESYNKLPELYKSDLLANNEAIHTRIGVNTKPAVTSGTSGQALKFDRSESWDSINRASVMRGYSWHDVNVWERNGYFWGYNLQSSDAKKIWLLDFLQNRKRLFRFNKKDIQDFSHTIKKASYVGGYSSMIYQVAKTSNELGINFKNIKMVKGTSETILPYYQDEVKKAFGRKMISEYGATETGLIAFECEEGSLHVNMENIYLEVNENSDVVVTNFASDTFPIVKYNIGDMATLSFDICKCGKEHVLISELIGRKGKNIVGKSEEYPGFTFYYIFKNILVKYNTKLNYKAVQNVKGTVEMFIELPEEDEKVREMIEEQRSSYFKDDVIFHYTFLSHFSAEKKKTQSFESNL
ncbi:phenylacetate--CoA ligase family protein [Salinimonas sediminis]|uniref:Phenylacetate--CoA ligase family protein n=1 Tax=Salinimonas sediminis TaxID=2303538 RepID=A0A346NP76_9ALTE|nr:phenylacetate--CoA ligase family protein [Salinimonas sediminis]AXR07333.1 phenylacetate--CoA ligase family protein [Salinimonas sediminis]